METPQLPWKHAIVVGASSGIGEEIARQLTASGCHVALIARREDRLIALCQELNGPDLTDLAFYLVHDVRKTNEAATVFQQATTMLGGLDLFVYAAGIMPVIAPGSYPTETDVDIIDTNFAGAVAWLNTAADRFQRGGSGTIIGLSSVAGDRGRRGNPVYNASKAALDSYLESLRNRLAVRGITVLTAKPGYVRTPLIEGLSLPGPLVSDSSDVARGILSAAASRRRVVYVPFWWRWIMLIIRSIPAPVFERLNI